MPGKLGIVAGAGSLPARLIDVCRRSGREVFVLAFEDQTDPATVEGVDHAWFRFGAFGAALKALRASGVEELVMVGSIKRPDIRAMRPDLRSIRFLTKVGAHSLGDDALLSAVVNALDDEGFRVVGIDTLVQDLLVRPGPVGALEPDEQAERDIARGITVARALGAVDVGQAVVVQEGLVLGVEAIEGTDKLLERCGELRRKGAGGVLVKIKKPGQESRVDLPTIGVNTVETAARVGLRGIAVEAGGSLIIDRTAVVAAADAAGLFVIGVSIPS